ncbi:hypothetical protein A6F68_01577 [Tsuneonella dongtanensis]|uniref:DUF937 domain-containing protein n=1 Tax=Tsuneonella dongtanensis TaxID=692370 RepID=A0A1B2AD43_9SPHN|nr:DUF937 domain-containing protein [Tsuneonella dongtanensis]ANY20090.1 hypothetical protein A6F68_01577 [Tsuneonella dongtanensis]
MNLSQVLQQSGAIDSMARELNIDSATAKTAAGALLPAIVAGMGRSQAGPGGSGGGLGDILGGGLGGGLLDSVLGAGPTPTGPGNDILGQIFGSKDVSRGVAEEVAGSTGLPPELLKKMLPILAMAVVGYMMKGKGSGTQGGAGGALGGAIGGILGQVVTGMLRR